MFRFRLTETLFRYFGFKRVDFGHILIMLFFEGSNFVVLHGFDGLSLLLQGFSHFIIDVLLVIVLLLEIDLCMIGKEIPFARRLSCPDQQEFSFRLP